MKYHDKRQIIQEAMKKANEIIQNQPETNSQNQTNSNNLPEGCVPIEMENAMKDFEDIVKKIYILMKMTFMNLFPNLMKIN